MSQKELKDIQSKLGKKVDQSPLEQDPKVIAGFDSQHCNINESVVGHLNFFDFQTTKLIDNTTVIQPKKVSSYIPGFLSLIELPIFIQTWKQREIDPDLIVFDGNGMLHPRNCGLATHVSFIINLPTFGIAKSLLGGEYSEFNLSFRNYSPIYLNQIRVGDALCTKDQTNPVFVSVGNNITLEECRKIALKFSKYRVPELTRQPDIRARRKCKS